VEPFSTEHFDPLARNLQLRSVAREFQQLEVQGVASLIRIQNGGIDHRSPKALESNRGAFLRVDPRGH